MTDQEIQDLIDKGLQQKFKEAQVAFDTALGHNHDGRNSRTISFWKDHSPIFGGYSVNPTLTYCRYTTVGTMLTLMWQGATNGTYPAGTVTMTVPVAPKYAYNNPFVIVWYSAAFVFGGVSIPADSTIMTIGQHDSPNFGATFVNNFAALSGGFGEGVKAVNIIQYEINP